ncbi:MAG: M6 family metalloprotease domain-containing protein [Prevotella sp.]|nr:M6 family metalloprotease domain-containing protein [Prevotella sp.]
MKLLFTLLFAALAQGLFASKAMPSKQTVTLQDGTTRVISLRGDEHFSFFASSRGELIIRENNTWRLATNEEISAARLRLNEVKLARQGQSSKAKSSAEGYGIIADKPFPCTGTPKALVILVSFSDRDFEYSADSIKALFNGEELNEDAGQNDTYGSLAQFMAFCSDSLFIPQFDFAGPYQLGNTVEYYGQNSGGSDAKTSEFIKDACTAADSDIDFSQYDSDGDGYVDLVYIVYAGFGENWGQNPDYLLWPKSGTGSYGTYDNVKVNRYGINQELAGYESLINDATGKHYLNGIGVLAHEFCHTMGMFDVYPTADWEDISWFDNQSMEYWSLMDNGENNLNGYWPTPLNAFERELFGWLDIDTLTEAANITLAPLMDGGKAYKIINDNDTTGNEFYILESIPSGRGTAFYHGMRGNGMLVSHINYDANSFSNFGHPNNVQGEPRYTIIPADGIIMTSYRMTLDEDDSLYISSSEYNADHAADTYPGTTETTEFTDYKAYTGTVDKPVTAIAQDGFAVSFKFCGGIEDEEENEDENESEDEGETENGIAAIAAEALAGSAAFNLSGQRVSGNYRGIIVSNGKKILRK